MSRCRCSIHGWVGVGLCVSISGCAAPVRVQQTGGLTIEFENQAGRSATILLSVPCLQPPQLPGVIDLSPGSIIRMHFRGVNFDQEASAFVTTHDMHGEPPVEFSLGFADRDAFGPPVRRWVLLLDERGLPMAKRSAEGSLEAIP